MNIIQEVLILSALGLSFLVILGILKWCIGLCVYGVSQWGLETLLEGSRIEEYYSSDQKCMCLHDKKENTVPSQRTVRICSRKIEFMLNLVFFLTYPIAAFCECIKSIRKRKKCPDESQVCLINENCKRPKMLRVSTYGEAKNSKLEIDDTNYMMDQLAKSQDSIKLKKSKKHINTKTKKSETMIGNSLRETNSAKQLVSELLRKRIVFRNLNQPIGDLDIPKETLYSLRGYFINAENNGYTFITPCPFKQHWVVENGSPKQAEAPQVRRSSLFMINFKNSQDVYESNELSLLPKGVCINTEYLKTDTSE